MTDPLATYLAAAQAVGLSVGRIQGTPHARLTTSVDGTLRPGSWSHRRASELATVAADAIESGRDVEIIVGYLAPIVEIYRRAPTCDLRVIEGRREGGRVVYETV